MAEYIIQGETLTAIADAIRAKKETTAILTPAQMAVEIEGIVTGDDLPNAEDVSFGTQSDAVEYGIVEYWTTSDTNLSNNVGYKFTVVKTMACLGIRAMFGGTKSTTRYLKLWDVETQTAIEALTVTGSQEADKWIEYRFAEPFNLFPGKTYAVSMRGQYLVMLQNQATFNDNLANAEYATSATEDGCLTAPTTSAAPAVDIIISEALTESVVTEYKVQAETMDGIAEEVQRITGATNKLSPAQMLTALQNLNITLQSKTVTPAETAQTVTPDSGYYGLSSVTVEAIPVTESEATE